MWSGLRTASVDVCVGMVIQDCREKLRVEARNAHYTTLLETKQYKDRHVQHTILNQSQRNEGHILSTL